jgi:hypothetical protein
MSLLRMKNFSDIIIFEDLYRTSKIVCDLPVLKTVAVLVFFWCETWYFTVIERQGLRAFENMRRKIFELRKVGITEGCRKTDSGEVHNL